MNDYATLPQGPARPGRQPDTLADFFQVAQAEADDERTRVQAAAGCSVALILMTIGTVAGLAFLSGRFSKDAEAAARVAAITEACATPAPAQPRQRMAER